MKTVFFSQIVQIISQALIYITSVYFFGVAGAFIAIAIYYVPPIIYLILKNEGIRWSFSQRSVKKLISSGFPWMLSGLIFTLFRTFDRWSVLILVGTSGLGFYTISSNLAGVLSQMPVKIASLLNQYLREARGAGLTENKLWEKVDGILIITLLILIPLTLFVKHLSYLIINNYLIEYKESIILIDLSLYAAYSLSIFHFAYQFMISINQKTIMVKYQVLSLFLSVLVFIIVAVFKGDLIGVALSFVLTSVFLGILSLIAVSKAGIPANLISYKQYFFSFVVLLLLSSLTNHNSVIFYVTNNTIFSYIGLFIFDAGVFTFILIFVRKMSFKPDFNNFFNRKFK